LYNFTKNIGKLMVKVGIVGSTGRMGAHLIKNVLEDDSLRLSVLHIFDD